MNSNDFKDTDDRKIASFDHASCNDHTRMLKILSYYMPDQYHTPLATYIKMLELQHLLRTPVHNFRHAAKPSDPPFEQTDFSETVSSQMNTSSSDAASPQLNASSSQETDISSSLEQLLQELQPYCNSREKEMLANMTHSLQTIQQFRSMLEMIEMIKEIQDIFGQGEGGFDPGMVAGMMNGSFDPGVVAGMMNGSFDPGVIADMMSNSSSEEAGFDSTA